MFVSKQNSDSISAVYAFSRDCRLLSQQFSSTETSRFPLLRNPSGNRTHSHYHEHTGRQNPDVVLNTFTRQAVAGDVVNESWLCRHPVYNWNFRRVLGRCHMPAPKSKGDGGGIRDHQIVSHLRAKKRACAHELLCSYWTPLRCIILKIVPMSAMIRTLR